MTSEQKRKCHLIIHATAAATAAIGAGLAQLPMSDNAAIVPLQLSMIINLGAVFGIRLQQSTAESTLGTATASILGRSLSQILWGWFPIAGNASNALTAGIVTETLGWAVAKDFSTRSPCKNLNKGKVNT